jgi:hypothetical protein
MIRLTTFVSSVVLFCAIGQGWAAPLQSGLPQAALAGPASAVILSAGTKVELAVTAPVWARTAKPGDPLYTQTDFPVVAGNSIAIPAGTYVEGRIEAITEPTRRTSRAELKIAFTKIIFANGYTIVLPDFSLAGAADAADGNVGPAATVALVTAEVSTWNDLLLDNGAQIEMTLAAPLVLDTTQVANAMPLSRAPAPGKFKSATLCRPTAGDPGSPGTPDTVIPGSPGTPSITIPGGPGMPDTTIPGTPGTPPTVIPGTPGSPGTPGTVCPAAPIVISSVPVPTMRAQSQNSVPATK